MINSMPRFSVSRTILIQAPLQTVHATVRDFKQWPVWSPWLIAEPDCRVTYADDGKSYTWDGRITGSGEMEVVNENAPNAIQSRTSSTTPSPSRWKLLHRRHPTACSKVIFQPAGAT